MRLVSLSGVESVVHPVHGEAAAGDGGVFDVDDLFGHALLRDAAHWREESDHLATQARDELEALSEPGQAAKVLAELRDKVTELEAKVADLEDQLTSPTPAPEPTKVPTKS